MPPPEDRPLRLYLSCAPEDRAHKERLVRHLRGSARLAGVEISSADKIGAGAVWKEEITREIARADVALLLLSADLLSWPSFQDDEVPTLSERRARGGLKVVPVLLRSCLWDGHPLLADLRVLPEDGRPVADPDPRDEAMTEVAREIARLATGAPEVRAAPADLGERARARLLAGIDALPGTEARSIARFLDDYAGPRGRPNHFWGREDDVGRVRDWIDRACATGNLVVTAPAGRGKSALLVRLALSLTARDDLEVAFVPISARRETARPEVFLRCLVARLAAMHGDRPRKIERELDAVLLRIAIEYLERPLPNDRAAVILLDGLDEAPAPREWVGLLPARHPASTRIIVSARQRADDPDDGAWLRDLGWKRGEDAEVVTLPPLEETDVATILAELPPPLDGWARRRDVVSKLTRLCEGEPLTLWFASEWLLKLTDPSALDTWAPGLQGAFKQWWIEQRARWGDETRLREPAVQAVLRLLAVAKGALTRADLVGLDPEALDDETMVDEAVLPLVESHLILGEGDGSGYVLAHPGFASHLRATTKRAQSEERLARYCRTKLGDLSSGDLRPEHVPRYVVLHGAAHLAEHATPPATWMQLCSHRWYEAWQAHEPGASGFLRDVMRAWDAVTAAGGPDAAGPLADEARCALARGSAGSVLTNVHPELLGQLLAQGVWTPEQAFAHVRAAPVGHPGQASRADLLKTLVPHASPDLLTRIFDAACDLQRDGHYGGMEDILPHMAEKAPSEAVVQLRRIAPEGARARFFLRLVKHVQPPLRDALLRELRDLALGLEAPAERAHMLAELAALVEDPEREDLYRAMLVAARQIPEAERHQRLHAFTPLAATVPEASTQALRAVSALEGPLREYWLSELVEKLPQAGRAEAIARYRTDTEVVTEPAAAAQRWRKLLEMVPEDRPVLLAAALDAVSRIADPVERGRALLTVLGRAGEALAWRHEATPRALEIVSSIDDTVLRLELLDALRDVLPQGEVWRRAEELWGPVEEALRGPEAHRYRSAVRGSLRHAPPATALYLARRIALSLLRAEALMDVVHRLPRDEREGVMDEAFDAARAVEDAYLRTRTLLDVLVLITPARYPAVLEALDAAISSIPEAYSRTCMVLELAQRCGELWPEIIDVAAESIRTDDLPHTRFDHLCALVRIASGERRAALFDEALAEARRDDDHGRWPMHLSRLVDLVPKPERRALLEQGLRSIEHLDDEAACIDAAVVYAGSLPANDVVELAGWIDQGPDRTRASTYLRLLEYSAHARETLFERAHDAVQKTAPQTPDDMARSELLARLTHFAAPETRPRVIGEALAAARAELAAIPRPSITVVEDPHVSSSFAALLDNHVSAALRWLAQYLHDERLADAIEIAEAIASPIPRAEALARLLQTLDPSERERRAEDLLAQDLRAPADGFDPRPRRRRLVELLGGSLPLPRRLALEKELPGSPGDLPWLWPDLPDEVLFDRLDHWLLPHERSHTTPQTVALMVSQLHPPRGEAVVSWIVERARALRPSEEAQILVAILPLLPAREVDRCFDLTTSLGRGGAVALGPWGRVLSTHQLDRALALLEPSTSPSSPRDARLEALAQIAAERLTRDDRPRAHCQRLVHDTLRARSETRADALAVISALQPLVVGLGGEAAAVGVVRAIRDVGTTWR